MIYENKDELIYQKLAKRMRPKYMLERIIAIPMLVLASPIFLFVAILIKLDGISHPENAGSVFYTELRNSAGKVFRVIKFRTIPVSTVEWINENPDTRSSTGAQTQKTWAGKIILNWYLDELPQLINVLKGEMSIVGPRPHICGQHKKEIELGLTYRNYLKAGILGVPQACKRNQKYAQAIEDMANRHKTQSGELRTLDGFYAKKCLEKNIFQIFLFDFTLIARGLLVVCCGHGK